MLVRQKKTGYDWVSTPWGGTQYELIDWDGTVWMFSAQSCRHTGLNSTAVDKPEVGIQTMSLFHKKIELPKCQKHPHEWHAYAKLVHNFIHESDVTSLCHTFTSRPSK